MAKITDDYYIYDMVNREFLKVAAVPVTIEGFEELDLFAHVSYGALGLSISEGRTGTRIATGSDEDDASTEALLRLMTEGKAKALATVARMVQEHGLSPRYTTTGAAPTAAPAPPSSLPQAENLEAQAPASEDAASNKITGPSSDLGPCG